MSETDQGEMELPSPHGRQVGRYRLERRLGRGAMGDVWLGVDASTGTQAAVKLVRPDAPSAARGQFEREWRAIARLEHPNIVHLYEVGEAHLATAFIDGPNLERRLQSAIAPELAVEWTLQIASALAHAHARGVVHRDVKPGNILLNRNDDAFLADFGLALFEGDLDAQRAGTPTYMAPEQRKQAGVGVAADQYALGRTLLAMLIGGRPPREPAAAFALLREDLPYDLLEVLRRSMRTDPDQRWPSIEGFSEALAAVELGVLESRVLLSGIKRPIEGFAWAAGCVAQASVGHDIDQVAHRLSAIAVRGLISMATWDDFRESTEYVDFGWSMYGRRSRLGPLDAPQAIARASEVVVLLHGWGCTRAVWSRVAQKLCRDNAELLVLVPDVQGFGESRFSGRWPTADRVAPDGLYSAVLSWLSALGLADLPTVIAGHSMSGIAVLAGRDRPGRRHPYRVSIAPPWLSTHWSVYWWAKLGTPLLVGLTYLGPAFRLVTDSVSTGKGSMRITAPIRAEMIRNMRLADRTVIARIAQGVARGQEPAPEAIHRTMILAGDHDPMIGSEPIRRAASRLGIPDSHVRILSTASHFPHISEPDHPENTARNTAEIVSCIDELLMACRDPTQMVGLLPQSHSSETLASLFDG